MTMIREIHLENLLSFGPDSPALPLRGLNVLIGPNGSGKSNLIEAIGLLQSRLLAEDHPTGARVRWNPAPKGPQHISPGQRPGRPGIHPPPEP